MNHPRAYPSPRRALALFAALLPLAGCSNSEPSGPKPNVLLVVVDTLRADRLGCYGYPRPTSPAIDALAAEGALFETVSAQAPWTLVSMTSMVSGRYVTAHREFPADDWQTLAETFRAAGYRTIGISANPLLDDETGFSRGFDHYRYYGPGSPHGGLRNMERLVERLWDPVDAALAPDGDGERAPLFIYIQPFDPHEPYHSHPGFNALLPRAGARPFEPEGWHARQLADAGLAGPEEDLGWGRALEELALERGRYDQEVRYVDQQLEVLLAGLRERGVLDDALIALVSDHGEGLWDHLTPGADPTDPRQARPDTYFFQSHGHDLYQPATLTPFILWGRDVPPGVRVSEPVENVDLYATLLHIAELDRPGGIDGHSLVGLMRGEEDEWRRYAFAYVRHSASVYDHQTGLKLVEPTEYGFSRGLRPELYDVPKDPLERTDLAGERPAEVERLRAELSDWIERNPTRRTTAAERSARRAKMLEDLGYTGEHAPGMDDEDETEDADEAEQPLETESGDRDR